MCRVRHIRCVNEHVRNAVPACAGQLVSMSTIMANELDKSMKSSIIGDGRRVLWVDQRFCVKECRGVRGGLLFCHSNRAVGRPTRIVCTLTRWWPGRKSRTRYSESLPVFAFSLSTDGPASLSAMRWAAGIPLSLRTGFHVAAPFRYPRQAPINSGKQIVSMCQQTPRGGQEK